MFRRVLITLSLPVALPLLLGVGLVGITALGVLGLAVRWGDTFF